MRHPAWILGFHGCDRSVAEGVLAGRDEVRRSTNTYDWLGSGAYFWENNPARALDWARFLAKQGRTGPRAIKEPAVIGAIIDPGNCLDLTDASSLELVQEAHDAFIRAQASIDAPVPKNEPAGSKDLDHVKRYLDCAVLNFVHDMRISAGLEPVDTICSPFVEGGPLYPGGKILAKTHVQWCVRDPARSIVGYFRPRDIKATEV